jgi:hypothetical protein
MKPKREVDSHAAAAACSAMGRLEYVVEAVSMRPLGVLPPESAPAPSPSGFNPYFDLPPA